MLNLLNALLGGTANTTIHAIENLFDKLFTSDEERQQAELLLEKLRSRPLELQAELNLLEAKHYSLFVAGWRPFIGYICGLSLAMIFIINPCIMWYTGRPGPTMPTEIVIEIIIALLGLGGLRTFEKITGRAI